MSEQALLLPLDSKPSFNGTLDLAAGAEWLRIGVLWETGDILPVPHLLIRKTDCSKMSMGDESLILFDTDVQSLSDTDDGSFSFSEGVNSSNP